MEMAQVLQWIGRMQGRYILVGVRGGRLAKSLSPLGDHARRLIQKYASRDKPYVPFCTLLKELSKPGAHISNVSCSI